MNLKEKDIPDSTAVRVALWRALHIQVDAKPHILSDEIGLQLVNPAEGWKSRPDMHPQGTSPFRASIVVRARFIEDFVRDQMAMGLTQYIILGAGLDTFAQRNSEVGKQLIVFEVEQPETQAWKQKRLVEIGYEIPSWLRFVPVNFEAKSAWWDSLANAGFDDKKPAVVTSIGVSMYLTREAIIETMQQMLKLAKNSKFVMTFMLPLDLVDSQDRPGYEMSLRGARNSGTPFISFFSPDEMTALAHDIGFEKVEHFSTASLTPKYFANRADGLRPSTGEELLICTI